MLHPCRSDGAFVEPQSFFFLQKACTLSYRYAGRDEVGRLNSDDASAFMEKDDAAHTCAKFVYLLL